MLKRLLLRLVNRGVQLRAYERGYVMGYQDGSKPQPLTDLFPHDSGSKSQGYPKNKGATTAPKNL